MNEDLLKLSDEVKKLRENNGSNRVGPYPKDFKKNVVKLLSSVSLGEAERSLSIPRVTLKEWREKELASSIKDVSKPILREVKIVPSSDQAVIKLKLKNFHFEITVDDAVKLFRSFEQVKC